MACPDRVIESANLCPMARVAVTAVAVGLAIAGCGSGDEPKRDPAPAAADFSGAPRPLAALGKQANQLLGGGKAAFRARLKELRGYPVVVNKWASWCPPCRAEFPFFRDQARKRSKKVAFLGVDSNDSDSDAREFLRKLPVSYPSYRDPDSEIAAALNAGQAFPATAYYDRRGRLAFLHQGGYASEAKLAEDIERYAR